jgi:hypothetical protein
MRRQKDLCVVCCFPKCVVTMKLERIVGFAEVILKWMRQLTIWSLRAAVGLVGVVAMETIALVWFVDGAARPIKPSRVEHRGA